MVTWWDFFASFRLEILFPLPWQNVFDVFKASTHVTVGSNRHPCAGHNRTNRKDVNDLTHLQFFTPALPQLHHLKHLSPPTKWTCLSGGENTITTDPPTLKTATGSHKRSRNNTPVAHHSSCRSAGKTLIWLEGSNTWETQISFHLLIESLISAQWSVESINRCHIRSVEGSKVKTDRLNNIYERCALHLPLELMLNSITYRIDIYH